MIPFQKSVSKAVKCMCIVDKKETNSGAQKQRWLKSAVLQSQKEQQRTRKNAGTHKSGDARLQSPIFIFLFCDRIEKGSDGGEKRTPCDITENSVFFCDLFWKFCPFKSQVSENVKQHLQKCKIFFKNFQKSLK